MRDCDRFPARNRPPVACGNASEKALPVEIQSSPPVDTDGLILFPACFHEKIFRYAMCIFL